MSGHDEYGTAREDVLAEIRENARALASRGLRANEIAHRLDEGLTATERELLGGIVRQVVVESRRAPSQVKGSPRHANLRGPESVAGGPRLLAARERWGQVRRRAGERAGSSRTRSVPPIVPVALAAGAAGLLLGLMLANRGNEGGATTARAGAASMHRSAPASPLKRRAPVSSKPESSSRRGSRVHAPTLSPGRTPHPSTADSQRVPASGAQLNDRGFQLMNAGRYEEAIPILRRAVSASPRDRNDLTYAYALFNLGRSLRLAGRSQEAIPLLERRLRIDNQRATVRRELEAARRSVTSTGGAR